MKNSSRLILSLLLCLSQAWAIDMDRLMVSGNDFYEQGDFENAIAEYEKILDTEVASTALYYNLGCAYFNQKTYGKAILYFEKARQLSPRDPDVLHNLEFSKLFLKDRFDLPEPMPLIGWIMKVRQSVSLWELQWLEMFLFGIFILSIISYRLLREGALARYLFTGSIMFGILLLLMGGWLLDRANALGDKHAVLLVSEANISSAPIPGSSTLFVIHEGTTAEILDATDTWYEIKLMDGKTGWIVNEAVGIY